MTWIMFRRENGGRLKAEGGTQMLVRDLMTTELFTLRTDHKLDLADDILHWQRIRHIPVVNPKGRLVGLLTHRDILKASVSSQAGISTDEQRELYRYLTVGEIMQKNVVTVAPDSDLRAAAAQMIDGKIGCLPVVEGKKLVGILTEADFMRLAWETLDRSSAQKDFSSVRKYALKRRTKPDEAPPRLAADV